jgi:hypothetical protein
LLCLCRDGIAAAAQIRRIAPRVTNDAARIATARIISANIPRFRAFSSLGDAGIEKGRLKRRPKSSVVTEVLLLLDNLDDTACPRLDQNRAAIYHRVSMPAHTILRRHIVVGHTFFRQNGTNPQVFPILI